MSDLSTMTEGEMMLTLVLRALQSRDAESNELAAECLTRKGTPLVPVLVREALNTKNKPDYRTRVLNVVARIGPPYGEAMLDFPILLRTPNKAVREAARDLFGFTMMGFGANGK